MLQQYTRISKNTYSIELCGTHVEHSSETSYSVSELEHAQNNWLMSRNNETVTKWFLSGSVHGMSHVKRLHKELDEF